MVTATSLPALPDPKSIKDEASASDALCSTLAVVATANRKLATVPREDQPGGLLEDLATFHEHLTGKSPAVNGRAAADPGLVR